MSSILRNLEGRVRSGPTRRRNSRRTQPPLPDAPLDEAHTEDYFTEKVRHMDRAPEVLRGGGAYLHLSSLIGACARREVLSGISPNGRTHNPFSADRVVWAMGRAAEHHVRTQFIAARRREGILGRWECRCGHTVVEGFYNSRTRCERCRGHANTFNELALYDHQHKIFGNPDLIYLRPDNNKRRVVEIKSMNAADFGDLVRPRPDHVTQALGYTRLGNIEGLDMDTHASVVYVCKDYRVRPRSTDKNQVGGIYREFSVSEADNPTVSAVLDDMWQRADRIRSWRSAYEAGNTLPLPERLPVCASDTSTVAKGCDQCVGCFARP